MAFMASGHFIHAHATGLHAEFYGKGEVLGLRAGTGQYGSDLHQNYYSLFASGNTVISNGASATAGGWVDREIHQAELVSMEPLPREEAISPHHSFTTARFLDEHNRIAPSQHQRTLALVRTSEQTGYYVDIFRARSDQEGEYHDYLYHNIGERLTLLGENKKPLGLSNDANRFSNPGFEQRHKRYHYDHPGWHFFEEIKTAKIENQGISAHFEATKFGQHPLSMHVHLPAQGSREISSVVGPPSLSSVGPYLKEKTPAFVVRQKGPAWNQPFVAIYEPTIGKKDEGTIKTVEVLKDDKGKFSGIKILSTVDKKKLTQFVLALEPGQSFNLPEHKLSFEGHFAIVTIEGEGKSGSLYLGDGSRLALGKRKLSGPSEYMEW